MCVFERERESESGFEVFEKQEGEVHLNRGLEEWERNIWAGARWAWPWAC